MPRFARGIFASLLALALGACPSAAFAEGEPGAFKLVTEEDDTITGGDGVQCPGYQLRFSGTVTDNTNGTCSVTSGASGAAPSFTFDATSGDDYHWYLSNGIVYLSNFTTGERMLTLDGRAEAKWLLGNEGADGMLSLYSEQGATDYVFTLNPNPSMTVSTNYTLPTNYGTPNQSLQTDGGGGLTWGSGGSSNSFETLVVPAGTNPVADSSTDTLTITETSFLTITGTAGTDTIDVTQVTTDLGTDGLIAANAVALATDTTGAYVADLLGTTNEIDVSGGGAENATVTVGIPASPVFTTSADISGSDPRLTLTDSDASSDDGEFNMNQSILTLSNSTTGARGFELAASGLLTLGNTFAVPGVRVLATTAGDSGFSVGDNRIGASEIDKSQDFVWTGRHTLTSGRLTLPNAITNPNTCTAGEVYFDTDATSGQRLYGCEGGVFVLQGDGGAGGGSPAGSGSELQYRVNGTTFGAVTSSSVSGANITLAGTFEISTTGQPNFTLTDTDASSNDLEISVNNSVASLTDQSTGNQFLQYDANQTATYLNQVTGCVNGVVTNSQGRVTCADATSRTETLQLPVYSAKVSGAFVTAVITNLVTATQGAEINAGDGNWRLLFDASTDESAVWYIVLPDYWNGHSELKLTYSMVSATSGNVEWEAALMCYSPGETTDAGVASFRASTSISDAVPGTAGQPDRVNFTLTDDGCSAGDEMYVYTSTDATDGGADDNATGDREMIGLVYEYTRL